jgi:glycosyltransferase involved in cell wall biosynthesis/SAM-dependent methyltransferase
VILDVLMVGDGASIHIRRLAQGLTARGVAVELATFEGEPIDGVPHHRLGSLWAGDARYLLAAPALALLIRTRRPKVVHAHYVSSYGVMATLALMLAAAGGRRPALVQTAWGTDLLVTARDSRLRRLLSSHALRAADHVTGDSLDLLDAALALAPGVPATRFVFGPAASAFCTNQERDPTIVSSRRLDPGMRVDLIVRAFRRARIRDPGMGRWRLVVAGTGSLAATIEQVAEADRSILFRGQLSPPDLAAVLRTASTFVSVPESDATSAALLESMASGLIPVVNDLPANREWVDPDVGQIVPRDPTDDELADALIAACQRDVDRSRIVERVRGVTWESQLDALEAVYVASQGGRSGAKPSDASSEANAIAREAALDDIQGAYRGYAASGHAARWRGGEPGSHHMRAERDRWVVDALRPSLDGLVVDAGCGDGALAVALDAAGIRPRRYVGIDLLEERVALARQRASWADFEVGSVDQLPFADQTVDAIVAMTLVSSLRDRWLRDRVAAEFRRVVRPGGRIIVYDMRYPSPANRNVVPLSVGELRSLFPGWNLQMTTLTLLPPIARSVLGAGARRYGLLRRLPLLRSHLGAVLTKP